MALPHSAVAAAHVAALHWAVRLLVAPGLVEPGRAFRAGRHVAVAEPPEGNVGKETIRNEVDVPFKEENAKQMQRKQNLLTRLAPCNLMSFDILSLGIKMGDLLASPREKKRPLTRQSNCT